MCRLKWFVLAAAIHLLLRLFHQTSSLNAVLACYTYMVIFAPFFSVLESFGLYRQPSLVSQLKDQHLDLLDTFKFLVAHAKALNQDAPALAATAWAIQIGSALSLVVSVFVAESITRHLINDRVKTYLAVWLSSVVSLLPLAALNTLWVAVLWLQMTPRSNLPL
jgi:hypothetical protein